MADTSIKQLEAEIEHLNRLVRQREEDNRCTKMMLRFREDKIQRMESLLGSFLPSEAYLLEENKALSEELQVLQAKVDRNPEVTRFALENIRLLDKLRRFQDFYEEGEREILFTEISELRDQLLQILDGNSELFNHPKLNISSPNAVYTNKESDSSYMELKRTRKELEDCKDSLNSCLEINIKLTRDINDLHSQLDNLKSKSYYQDINAESDMVSSTEVERDQLFETVEKEKMRWKDEIAMKHREEIMNWELEQDILKIILQEEKQSHVETQKQASCLSNKLEMENNRYLKVTAKLDHAMSKLKDAESVIEALESQQIISINEFDDLRELLGRREQEISFMKEKVCTRELRKLPYSEHSEIESFPLQVKLKKMQDSLDKAKRVNMSIQSDRAFETSHEREIDEVCRQVEAETAEVIICLQEELSILQEEVKGCNRKEMESKQTLVLLEAELRGIGEKLYLATKEKESLGEQLEGQFKDCICLQDELSTLQEEVKNSSKKEMEAKRTLVLLETELKGLGEKLYLTTKEKESLIEQFEKQVKDCNVKEMETKQALVLLEIELNELRETLHSMTLDKSNLEQRLEKQVTDFYANEIQAKHTLVILENELKELQEKLHLMTQDNESLEKVLNQKCEELRTVSEDWEQLAGDIGVAMADGHEALKDASDQVDLISSLLPWRNSIREQVGSMIWNISEKESMINRLQTCLEEAQDVKIDMEWKMRSLKGAALAITEAQQQESSEKEKEVLMLTSQLREKMSTIEEQQRKIEMMERQARKVEICATAAFVIVNRLSEKSSSYADVVEEVEKQIKYLKLDLEGSENNCAMLKLKLLEEEKHVSALEKNLEEAEKDILMKTKFKLDEFKFGVSTLNSYISTFAENVGGNDIVQTPVENSSMCVDGDDRLDRIERTQDISKMESYFDDNVKKSTNENVVPHEPEYLVSRRTHKDVCNRELTIHLLKKELEFALESFKGVQSQMHKLLEEKEEIRKSEDKNRENMECLTFQILQLQTHMNETENLSDLKMMELDHKLKSIDKKSQEASSKWFQDKEALVLELSDAKNVVAYKTAEASNLVVKCEEAQITMKEANTMLNALLVANEGSKSEIERLNKTEATLTVERDFLVHEVKRLNSSTDKLENQFSADLSEIADIITQVKTTFMEEFKSINCELHSFNSQILHSMNLTRSWLEDIWFDIIEKDCTVSVLHLCHMGVLLEAVTGLNAENGLLNHGLCESNSIVADLKEHNVKAKRELEMCRTLKGKLLVDIESSFDRILRKEDETGKLCAKLGSFEKKILNLQLQEEFMLARSNYMGSELSLLMKEVDLSNTDTDKLFELQAESFSVELTGKEFESLIFVSELKEVVLQKDDLERENHFFNEVLENMKKEVIFLMTEAELKKQIFTELEFDVPFLQKAVEEANDDRNDLSQKLKMLGLKISEMGDVNKALELDKKGMEEISCENDKLQDKLAEVMQTNERFLAQVQELVELRHSQSILLEDLSLGKAEMDTKNNVIKALKEDNSSLRSELIVVHQDKDDLISLLRLKAKYIDESVQAVDMLGSKLFRVQDAKNIPMLDRMFEEICENKDMASKLISEFTCLEKLENELISESMSLQAELSRKDEVVEGMLFDLSLLQESASCAKDQRNEFEKLVVSMEFDLKKKINMISDLELDITAERESLKLVLDENVRLRAKFEDALLAKCYVNDELTERIKVVERLEEELYVMDNALGQMNTYLEGLKNDLNEVTSERDHLDSVVPVLKEKLEMAQSLAEENEAIAIEARQIAESKNSYAASKEEEVKLLERSVEELESTVNVLEDQVDSVKREAERQRSQREGIEIELQAIKHQMLNIHSSRSTMDTDFQRYLEEKETDLKEAQSQIQILEKHIAQKDSEISQCRMHISELNLHAEAQALEYKQKFKALEAMAEQVKPETISSHVLNSTSTKSERNAAKSRGSSSPFKCIGLGLAQQINSEKEEELTAGRVRIEELEALASSRQKEIFMLNARLAAADSMTHDVMRDLLGLKSDMTNYASLLDYQHVQKITEKARVQHEESLVKEHEVIKLKQKLNEFIEERQGWLEEINRRHAELVAAQVACEKLRQRDQLLTTENEMLKADNMNHKKKVMGLEDDVKKLSGQQNLQQRIHHHAKIKEENNSLKIQNDDLSAKLHRAEIRLSRVKEELSLYCASNGISPSIDFDKEKRLINKLKESEGERMQLAQKLLSSCTSILKAAGITRPVSELSPSEAEHVLDQLKEHIASLERESHDMKMKSKIDSERIQLFGMKQGSSPVISGMNENCTPPGKLSRAPFLTSLSR
ncbi:hypothetical protein GIB67_019529 [Kingdonia uniflora]|uniref:Uncharacterized protein n=1 Tax=Kingdonia uniflora TaxID=39325 RepID=A0A7J7N065_9MAGN|nr:hypothetical protein GIB67_019529 [Kingdonia uniflora]